MLNGVSMMEWGRLAMVRDYIIDSGPGDIPGEPPELAPTAERLQNLFEFVNSQHVAWNRCANERIILNGVDGLKPNLDEPFHVKESPDKNHDDVVRSIPKVFFDELFQSESVFDNFQSNPDFVPHKLQMNLDNIEIILLNRIQNKTESFFSTMLTLHELHAETEKMIKFVLSARRKIRQLVKRSVIPFFNVLNNKKKQQRLLYLRSKFFVLASVNRSFEAIRLSIESADFTLALDLLNKTRSVLFEEQLERFACGKGMLNRLNALEMCFSEHLRAECTRLVTDNFSVDYAISLIMLWLQVETSTESLVTDFSSAMQNSSKSITFDVINRAVCEENINSSFNLCSPSDSCSESSLIEALCSLSEPRFTGLLMSLYSALTCQSERVFSICDAIDNLEQTDKVVNLSRQLQDAFRNATESAHARCARVIGIRKKAESELSLATVCVRIQAGLEFVHKDEQRCTTSFLAIRQLLAQQARLCFSQHHTLFMKQILNALDHETWQPTDAERRFQKMIDRRFSVLLPELQSSRQDRECEPWALPDWNDNLSSSSSSEDDRQSSPRAKRPYLTVVDERFRVTRSLLELLSCIQETFMIAHMLPREILPSDLISLQICSLLRNYNSRSQQLILGAAATSLPDSKVKQISAKMLCVVSQNIGFLLAVIPILNAVLHELFHDNHRLEVQLMQLTQIGKDLTDHRQNIFMKIISIMDEVVSLASKQLLVTGAINPNELEQTLADLMKQTRLLHRIVSLTLPPRQVNQIFTTISTHIGSALAETFVTAGLSRTFQSRSLARISAQLVELGVRVDHVPAFSDLDGSESGKEESFIQN